MTDPSHHKVIMEVRCQLILATQSANSHHNPIEGITENTSRSQRLDILFNSATPFILFSNPCDKVKFRVGVLLFY